MGPLCIGGSWMTSNRIRWILFIVSADIMANPAHEIGCELTIGSSVSSTTICVRKENTDNHHGHIHS